MHTYKNTAMDFVPKALQFSQCRVQDSLGRFIPKYTGWLQCENVLNVFSGHQTQRVCGTQAMLRDIICTVGEDVMEEHCLHACAIVLQIFTLVTIVI